MLSEDTTQPGDMPANPASNTASNQAVATDMPAAQPPTPTPTPSETTEVKPTSPTTTEAPQPSQNASEAVIAVPTTTEKASSSHVALSNTPPIHTVAVDNTSGISNIKTVITDKDKNNGDNDGVVYPHQLGHLETQINFNVDDSVKAGDTFEVKYSNNVQISDFFENRSTPPSIYNSGGELIATGRYDLNTRTLTYTFTDFVDKHNNVSAQLNLLSYIERDVVKQAGPQKVDVTVAGQTTSRTFDVKYQDVISENNVNINSFFDEFDFVSGEYSQVAYVNLLKKTISKPEVKIFGYGNNTMPESSSAVVASNDTVKVYEVPDGVTLADSYKPDFSKLLELTPHTDYTLTYNTNGTDMVSIKFAEQVTSKRYVVYTKGMQDLKSTQPLVQRVSLLGNDEKNTVRTTVYSENRIETLKSSASGQGEKHFNLGNRVWEDVNHNNVQDIADKGIANVTVTLKNPQTNEVLQTTVTDAEGYYLFSNLNNGDYIVEFTDPTVNAAGKQFVPVEVHVGNSEIDSDMQRVAVTIHDADDLSIDRGFRVVPDPTYTIGDKVWEDTNKNGIQDQNEPGIAGVKVVLTKADGTTEETMTDEQGMYHFTHLVNGQYKVTFYPPEGYEATLQDIGNDAFDSDGKEVTVTVNNADDMTIDSGFYRPTVEPTPEKPSEPGNPEGPTPEKPNEPSNPENPTPEKPSEPGNPENPTPEKPGEPMQPNHDPIKKVVSYTKSDSMSKNKKESLPETGEAETMQTPLIGSILALLGGLFILRRPRQTKKDNK
ncbi:SdrD B-like domain-containing protein [Staphylococcus lutrae]